MVIKSIIIMKNFFIATLAGILFLLGGMVYAQVGINTETPGATMDVVAAKTDGTTAEGIIAPRLKLSELISKEGKYGISQNGAIIYITDVSGATSAGKTANITQSGYYYYDNAADVWKPFGGGSGTSAGWSLTGNSGTTAGTNFLGTTDAQDLIIKTGTGTNTERMRVIGVNGDNTGNIGIGTTTPDKSAILDVSASNKAVRVPNVYLLSATDTSTVPSPQRGMIVYNTNGNQFAYFDGIQWRQPVTSTQGVVVPKLVAMAQSFAGYSSDTTLLSGFVWFDSISGLDGAFELFDPEGAVTLGTYDFTNGGKYTVPKDGSYQIFVNLTLPNPVDNEAWYVQIRKNTNIILAAINATKSPGSGASTCVSTTVTLAKDDIIQIYKSSQKGGWSGGGLTKLTIYRFE